MGFSILSEFNHGLEMLQRCCGHCSCRYPNKATLQGHMMPPFRAIFPLKVGRCTRGARSNLRCKADDQRSSTTHIIITTYYGGPWSTGLCLTHVWLNLDIAVIGSIMVRRNSWQNDCIKLSDSVVSSFILFETR